MGFCFCFFYKLSFKTLISLTENFIKLGKCDHCSLHGLGASGFRVMLIELLQTGNLIYVVIGGELYISHLSEVHLQYQSPLHFHFQRSSQVCDCCDVGTDNGCSKAEV